MAVKIFQMTIKYATFSILRPSKIYPNWEFLVWKFAIWQPWASSVLAGPEFFIYFLFYFTIDFYDWWSLVGGTCPVAGLDRSWHPRSIAASATRWASEKKVAQNVAHQNVFLKNEYICNLYVLWKNVAKNQGPMLWFFKYFRQKNCQKSQKNVIITSVPGLLVEFSKICPK
jgi:hypothetical protein